MYQLLMSRSHMTNCFHFTQESCTILPETLYCMNSGLGTRLALNIVQSSVSCISVIMYLKVPDLTV